MISRHLNPTGSRSPVKFAHDPARIPPYIPRGLYMYVGGAVVSSAVLWLAIKPTRAPPLAAATGAGVPYDLLYVGSAATLALDARPPAGRLGPGATAIAGSVPQLGDRYGEAPALHPPSDPPIAAAGGTRL